jgi:glucan-binding YG repeat protein
MRKQTKVVAVASAAALLAIGGAMTSFAAQGWVEEDGTWYYYDKDGNRVEDEWKKSGDNWFWMSSEENGAMATDALIEDDDNTYYVDSNGVMVTNTWVKVVNEDQDEDDDPAEYHYYYMQSNGKAYKGSGDKVNKKTIDGKQYAFDEDGIMLYGWVDEDGTTLNDEDGWAEAEYYFGSWEDGSMKTGWQKITVHDSDNDKDDDYDYWFNFKSNGKKRVQLESDNTTENKDATWKNNGKYYHFDTRGVMVYEWYPTENTTSNLHSASNWSYFNSPEDGAKVVKGWFKVVAPNEDTSFKELDADTFASDDAKNEDARWYYNDGRDEGLVVGQIKKIKGKYYGFRPDDGVKGGAMLKGLCALEMDGEKIVKVIDDDMDADDLDDFLDNAKAGSVANDVYLYYFGDADDEDTDGAMKTGNVTVNLDGESFQFKFRNNGGAESRGRGVTGVDDGDYIYNFGKKIKADSEDKYILVYADQDINSATRAHVVDYDGSEVRSKLGLSNGTTNADDKGLTNVYYGFGTKDNGYYLVNTSGKVQTGNKTGVKDGDDWYWYMKNGNIIMYTDSKDLGDGKVGSATYDSTKDLKKYWDTVTSANIAGLVD